ncbi:MAG: undecaprenyldiphospho-muramoylpentapeptide beta-N-acetylglucosaminyltransferase [Christensenellales bacterium]
MKRIILTGGGTAGHVTPHLALLPHLISRGYEIHYLGTAEGIERKIMAGQDLQYHVIQSGKLRRYFDWKNFSDPFRVVAGALEASRLMAELKPAVCFSKGGFVGVPVVYGAWRHRVPVLCHESDLTPGLANRISARMARKVACTFPECAEALGGKGVLTGTPLRPQLFSGDRGKGLRMAGFRGDKPVLLMMGGSLGAQSVNRCLREALDLILPDMDVLHLCGEGNLDQSLQGRAGYFQAAFLSDDLPDALAAADFVLSRAGANALCEFQALSKPMLLVPLPRSASRGDQILNAKSYAARGLARVLAQEDMNRESLHAALRQLAQEAPAMREAFLRSPAADGTGRILSLIEEVQA